MFLPRGCGIHRVSVEGLGLSSVGQVLDAHVDGMRRRFTYATIPAPKQHLEKSKTTGFRGLVPIGAILGLYWGYMWDNGKENGNY